MFRSGRAWLPATRDIRWPPASAAGKRSGRRGSLPPGKPRDNVPAVTHLPMTREARRGRSRRHGFAG